MSIYAVQLRKVAFYWILVRDLGQVTYRALWMLIEFRVENFRSLRDEQALTMEAGRIGESLDSRPRQVDGHGEQILPACVIYGANASGKSNVISSLAFMREAVAYSHREWDPEGGIPRCAFAWGGHLTRPTVLEMTFLVRGTKYQYGFSVNDEFVEEEWLYAWPRGHRQTWFEREQDKFKFGENLTGPNKAVQDVTRANALFLSSAAQHKHEKLALLYSWFRRIISLHHARYRFRPPFYYPSRRAFGPDESIDSIFHVDDAGSTLQSRIGKLLRTSDLGIVDVKQVEMETETDSGHTRRRHRILLQHQNDDEGSWLDLEEESDGTKTLFRLAPAIFRALDSGGLLVVDELESSLHPLLGLAIVRMFNCPNANPRNAQLVFTTHDTNLLGTTLGEPPLRRDQIWFTEKDREGGSSLFPLTDYKPRKSENLERGYLQGRYGAIPFLGDIGRIAE